MSTSVSISSITLSAPASYVTFSVIPQSYTDLIVVINGYLNSADGSVPRCRFNYDSGSNYSTTILTGTGTTPKSSRTISQTNLWIGSNDVGWSTNSSNMSTNILQIMNYSNDKIYKSTLLRLGQTGGSYPGVEVSTGLWASLSPINSISIMAQASLSGEFATGTTFNLYGINSANSGQAKATGGDTIIRDASYWYHVFNKSGTFTPKENINSDILIVAGGAGGSNYFTGGGGAGGLRMLSAQSLTAQNYVVTVGAGGAGVIDSAPNSGSNSSLGSFSATGGGRGGRWPTGPGESGGSGGGGSLNFSAGGSGNAGGYTPAEGFTGGAGGKIAGNEATGGGGGAGGVGGASGGSGTTGGAGGIGATSATINAFAAATSTGILSGGNYYFAGGGGGGSISSTVGAGGLGGGGSGGANGNGVSGLVNTGGGAGGSAAENLGSSAAVPSGGSGIIIVRYPV